MGKGTGFGLAMVYGTVEGHGGVVEVNSSFGEGSEFLVYLPLIEEESPAIDSEEMQVISGNGETILFVDDEKVVLETGRELLEDLNYRVLTASNGQQAVELFEAHKDEIDLLVMDVVMPVLGGVEAFKAICKIKPDSKVVVATGYDRAGTLRHRDGLTTEVVLPKPFRANELSQVVRKMLDL